MAGIIWWTRERENAARALAEQGATARNIARQLSDRFGREITACAVRCHARRASPPIVLLAKGARPRTR